ncbi:MAG: vWA domain-containing protein [Planctomycetaceae bacterium]
MSVVAQDTWREAAEYSRIANGGMTRESDPSADEVILLELVDDDIDRSNLKAGRNAFGGLLVSLLLHLWLMTNLAGWFLPTPTESLAPVLETKFAENVIHQEIEEAIPFELANPDERELEVREVTNAMSLGLAVVQTTPKVAAPAKQLLDEARVDQAKLPAYDVPEGLKFDDRLVVKGSTGEQLVQIESALDRVTWEIAQNLQESKVLVVWLMDGSASLKTQREAVAKRLRRIYGELGALENTTTIPRHEKGLLSGVVMFGEKTNFIVKPTDKFDDVEAGITNLPTDSSGVENVFTAVKQVVNLWSEYRTQQHRRIMLITITDEAGDDFGRPHLDAIAVCNRYGAKAFVIGPTAPFGKRRGFVPYVAPEDGKTYQLPIDLGPEAAMAENVSLPFWFNGPQYEYLSSGFAPYALARLVSETGGVYFLTNMTTMAGLAPIGTFDDATLRTFAPDYSFGEIEDFAKDVRKHPLRVCVMNAAQMSQRFKVKGAPRLDIRVTAANFRQVATEAQKDVAESQYMLDAMLQAFPPGIEKELDREPSLRWRMAFCLNYGRLLANKTRNLEYNYSLATIKTSLAESDINTRSNHWIFHPTPDVKNSGVVSKKGALLATDLLNRVVAEAPGTPWAIMATRELQSPFGIRIEERFIPPPPPPPPNKPQAAAPQKPRPLFVPDPKPAQPKALPPKPPVLPKL